MRVLFDQGTPVPLRNHLVPQNEVVTAYEMGWANLGNGELLQLAEDQGFDVLITTDPNLKYPQNLAARRIAIVMLAATSWPRIQKILSRVVAAVHAIQPGPTSRLRSHMTVRSYRSGRRP